MTDTSGLQTLESMSQAEWYNRWSYSQFRQYLKGKILEIGCGIGNFTKILSEFEEVYAIDINKEYLSNENEFPKRVKVGYGDIEGGKYFFKKQKFDCIVCLNVLEHIEKDDKALQNMQSLLNKKGILVLLVPAHVYLYNKIDRRLKHYRRYEKDILQGKFEKAGFKFLSIRRLNFLGAIGWFIAGNIFRNSYVTKNNIRIFNLIAPFSLRIENVLEPIIGTSILVIAKKAKEH